LQLGTDPRVAVISWKAGFKNLLPGNALKALGMSVPNGILNRTHSNAVFFAIYFGVGPVLPDLAD